MNNNTILDKTALEVLKKNRVAVFIVAYNASKHIKKVLSRIPPWVAEELVEIFLIDDSSNDNTVIIASQLDWPSNHAPLRVFKTPFNQGYGGNQKIGYSYAIEKNFDIVVLLHGDGQYAPEAITHLIAEYINDIDAVFGSRFIEKGNALSGGMPLYKFIGNTILSSLQNYFMKATLSEWHSGYRSYRTSLLKRVPFRHNSNGFDFDSEIIIQTLGSGGCIKEVPIPTFYGDEICHVNGIKYAYHCLKNVIQYRMMLLELFYDVRFDLSNSKITKKINKKKNPTTLDFYIDNIKFDEHNKILIINNENYNKLINIDNKYDTIILLDILQNEVESERLLIDICRLLNLNGILYISTANVAYLPVRLMLLAGYFNYGRSGILDKRHHRLYTKGSMKKLLNQSGFKVIEIKGFGPPIIDKIGNSFFLKTIDYLSYIFAKKWQSLFGFELLFIAKKQIDLEYLINKTINYGVNK